MAEKGVAHSPAPPFMTSTMQQDAFNRLGLSPSATMRLAQELYEGPGSAESELCEILASAPCTS